MALILGIDPGSRITGFGIVRHAAGRQEYVTSGCIRVGDGAFPERLQKIFHYLSELIGQYQPDVVSIEQVFMARNPDSALKLGQARGRLSLLRSMPGWRCTSTVRARSSRR